MKKRLSITVYKPDGTAIEKIICEKLDSSKHITVMSRSFIVGNEYSKDHPGNDYHFAETMDHFNIFEGMVTIYYKSGLYMEINRIYG